MVHVSVVIIAHNEEENLQRCLESVASLADEIIVVINDCTDHTAQVAEKWGAKVFEQSWLGFCAQKQFALEKATQNWVLSLDADEALSEQLQKNMLLFFEYAHKSFDVVTFNRRNNYLHRWLKHGDAYPDKVVRLFRKEAVRWSGGNVHESITYLSKVRIKHLQGDLLHYTFKNLETTLKKQILYAQLFAKDKHRQYAAVNFSLMLKIVFDPLWGFARSYFIKAGFLDGIPGLIYAMQRSMYIFLKYAFMMEFLLKT
ncbi:MAG: glycosyltransferase family 2 protein [Puniceicoccales bacterium]|jgi:glycosyltransferase involved in cell wall biosynthesis|nr:glycosyltransferase family 2 protein [Puniceicoccales bacterium]